MKYVFLNSGGLDSLAVAILLKNAGHELYSIFINLGADNSETSSVAAQKIADMYCTSHKVITVDGLKGIDETSKSIPNAIYIYHFIASSYANLMGIDAITGGHKNDFYNPNFTDVLDLLVTGYKEGKPRTARRGLYRPLKDSNSSNQTYMIAKDSPLLSQTVSCIEKIPCGECAKCKMRLSLNIDTPK